MADVIIRGMAMPETCGLCKLCLDDSRICNGYCMFFHRRVNMMERDKNCPLVPIPAGHGRLIDAEAIMTNIGDVPYKGSVKRVLMSAPTIVPAEGGTDNG